MSSPAPPDLPPETPAAPVNKIKPLVWILGGIGLLLVCVTLTCGLIGLFAVRAVKNAVFDSELMHTNPGLALAKMAAALHPDLQTVSTDERAGTITMKEKSTGKVMTFRFDPAQKTLVMVGDDGREVTISAGGGGQSGAIEVQSADGAVHVGSSAGNMGPAWMPVYPGSTPENTSSVQTPDGSESIFTFTTADSAPRVISYFQNQLRSSGFNVGLASSGEQGGMVQAEDGSKKHSIILNVDSSGDATKVREVVVEKK